MTIPLPATPADPSPTMIAASVVAFVAYFVLLHLLIATRAMPALSLGLVAAPWIVFAVPLVFRRRAGRRWRIALAAVGVVVLGFVARAYGGDLGAHAEWMLFGENLAFLAALSAMFGISLLRGPEALITRLARVVHHGDLPARVVGYTRSLTLAWAGFFAVAALVSTALFFTQSRAVWSAFVNLAMWPLTGAMFAVEYAIRIRVLRDVTHVSMMTGVRAFRQHARVDEGNVR